MRNKYNIISSNKKIIMKKNPMKKNQNFWTLLKRPKMTFLGEQNFTIKKPPYIPPDLNIGGVLNRNCPDVDVPPVP